jgi:hypothetical protein
MGKVMENKQGDGVLEEQRRPTGPKGPDYNWGTALHGLDDEHYKGQERDSNESGMREISKARGIRVERGLMQRR